MLNAMLDVLFSSRAFLPVLCGISVLATVLADVTAKKIQKDHSSDMTVKFDKQGNVIQITVRNSDSEKASDLMRKIESMLKEQDDKKSEQEH